jgi:hypothetical protein
MFLRSFAKLWTFGFVLAFFASAFVTLFMDASWTVWAKAMMFSAAVNVVVLGTIVGLTKASE